VIATVFGVVLCLPVVMPLSVSTEPPTEFSTAVLFVQLANLSPLPPRTPGMRLAYICEGCFRVFLACSVCTLPFPVSFASAASSGPSCRFSVATIPGVTVEISVEGRCVLRRLERGVHTISCTCSGVDEVDISAFGPTTGPAVLSSNHA